MKIGDEVVFKDYLKNIDLFTVWVISEITDRSYILKNKKGKWTSVPLKNIKSYYLYSDVKNDYPEYFL